MTFYFNNGERITLKEYEAPTSVTFLEQLPRTTLAGKIDYELLRKMTEKEHLANGKRGSK